MDEVAVLLGYKNSLNGTLADIAEQRVEKAFDVLINLQVPIICTGGFGENFNQSNQAHALHLQSALMNKGINASRFLPPSLSRNTYEDGKLTSETLTNKKVSRLHLITSDFHIQRGYLWMKLFMPEVDVLCHPATTFAKESELISLQEHEIQAIKNFYRDFPDFPPLETLEDWSQYKLSQL